jgi:hypothetical protein
VGRSGVGRSGASLVVDFSALLVGVDSLWILMSSTRLSTPKSVSVVAEPLGRPVFRSISKGDLVEPVDVVAEFLCDCSMVLT